VNDKILLRGLRVFGYHGVNPEEQELGQDFLIDLDIHVDTRRAAATDLVDNTVSYSGIVKKISHIVGKERYLLLETLATRLADAVLEDPRIFTIRVRVAKPNPPMKADLEFVGVEIERNQAGNIAREG
jgi:dihydroneopterin aldolase